MNEEQRMVQKDCVYWSMHRKLAMCIKPADILVSPGPVFTAGKVRLIGKLSKSTGCSGPTPEW